MRPLIFATRPATLVLWAEMAVVLFGLAPAVGRADVVLGNLGAGDGGSTTLDRNDFAAFSFIMGSQDYLLSDVQVRLTGSLGTPASTTTFQLESSLALQPSGNVLFTFDNPPTFLDGTFTYTFPAGSPFTLAANTTYWLVGSNNSISNSEWVFSAPRTPPSGSGATNGFFATSNNGTLGSWTPDVANVPLFQIDGTPAAEGVPKPSPLLLVGTVACVTAAVGWRRRRTRRAELAVMTSRQ